MSSLFGLGGAATAFETTREEACVRYSWLIRNAQPPDPVRLSWQANIAPLITRDGLSNGAADKAAAVAGGWLPGFSPRLRWPYRCASIEAATAIGQRARAELPELF